jgi:hypothetical protein
MKAVICAIAKNEAKYIKDFCEYHLNLGFDEIHIYDNGTDVPFKNDKVIVHPFRDVKNNSPQYSAYYDMMKTVSFDWCAFIDVDEFITLNGKSDVHEFLSSVDGGCAKMLELIYGDDDVIVPQNLDVPVYQRFTKVVKKGIRCYKYFVKKNDNVFLLNPHTILTRDKSELKVYDAKVDCFIRHYKTKSLSEFCDQKLNTPRVANQKERRTLDYFFQVNKKTPEKIAYLKSRGIEA